MQTRHILLLTLLLLITACAQPDAEATAVPPTSTPPPTPTAVSRTAIHIATDAPNPPFTEFSPTGELGGLYPTLIQTLSQLSGANIEIIITPLEGVLENVAAGTDFDAALLPTPKTADLPPNLTYTDPFLAIGQSLLILADNDAIPNPTALPGGARLGVIADSAEADVAATQLAGATAVSFTRASEAVQALINEELDAVLLDNFSAQLFADAYPEQLQIAGGNSPDAWVSRTEYALVVATDNPELLATLNGAIAQLQGDALLTALSSSFLRDVDVTTVDPGESRVGTPADTLVLGMVGEPTSLDPAALVPDLIEWEIKRNVMAGLYGFTPDSELQPLLASDFPSVTEDGLTYTVPLRDGLQFPDERPFTANDVVYSVFRASRLGNFLVNGFLKDDNGDGFADADAIAAVNSTTVQFRLQAPYSYFPSVLATPPYAPVSSDCVPETAVPATTCGGIGPYMITEYIPTESLTLTANPNWPGDVPAVPTLRLRLFPTATAMRSALVEFGSIDMAWAGLPFGDYQSLRSDAGLTGWESSAVFKSYIIFEQSQEPWDREQIRQAAALSIDREALAAQVFGGGRQPLYSPVPDAIPGHIPAFPQRDLEEARRLLRLFGYTESNKLEITLWHLNDGRYSPLEEPYANAIARQLEETNVFEVTLQSAPWTGDYQVQIGQCGYPAYIMGWPSPGAPTNYLDSSSWIDFFIENPTTFFCSNYDNEAMLELIAEAREEIDPLARAEIVAEIQTLWADELPTLPLTQEGRFAVALNSVSGFAVDGLGLLHYEQLQKTAP